MEHSSRNQQLLTSLRQSIVDKPPYMSGTLKLPESFFSLFYKLSKDDDAARSGEPLTLRAKAQSLNTIYSSHHRYVNLVNASPEKLEQLAQACEPASFGLKCKVSSGEMVPKWFSSKLDLFHTGLMNFIRDYLLEGTEATNNIKTELYKLQYSSVQRLQHLLLILRFVQVKGCSSSLTLIRHAATGCLARS